MHKISFLAIIPVLFFSTALKAQRKLTWNFNKQSNERVDSVFIDMRDQANKTVLKDSFALSGTRADVPLPAIMPGESKFNADIWSDMNKVRLKVHSNTSEDVLVRIVSRDGKTILQNTYDIRPGENNIEIDPGHLAQGLYIVD